MVAGVLHYRRAKVFNRGAERIAKRHLHRQVTDPELRRKLTPDYSFGCKRPTFSNDYYPTFTRAARRPRDDHDRADHADRDRSSPTAGTCRSTCWCSPPASTCGTPTSRRSASSAARARTSASGGATTRFQAYQGIAVPGLPEPAQPRLAVLLLGPVVLHHHRGPDEAHRPAASARYAAAARAPSRSPTRPTRSSSAGSPSGSATRCSRSGPARPRAATTSTSTARPRCCGRRRRSTRTGTRERFPLDDYAYALSRSTVTSGAGRIRRV